MSSSSALATRAPTTNLKSAILRRGTSQIATRVTSLAVMMVFVPSGPEARNLWLHSVQVAIAARALAVMGKDTEVSPDDAYLPGRLRGIGRFILLDTAADENGQKLCGFNHSQPGWRICTRWGLPEPIVNAIRSHHVMDPAGGGALKNLTRITAWPTASAWPHSTRSTTTTTLPPSGAPSMTNVTRCTLTPRSSARVNCRHRPPASSPRQTGSLPCRVSRQHDTAW